MKLFKSKEDKQREQFLKKKVSVGEKLTFKEKLDWEKLFGTPPPEQNKQFQKGTKNRNSYNETSQQLEVEALLKEIEEIEQEKLNVLRAEEPTNTTSIPGKKAGLFHNGVHCSRCRSLDVQFMQNNRKGFSVGKAAGGALLTGGIGTLAGFAGKKGNTNQWRCNNCGHTFKSKK